MQININIKQQQGAALVVGLIVLLIMTLLGVSNMSATTTELKIANNLQTKNHVFQAGETIVALVKDGNPGDPGLAAINWGGAGTQLVTSTGFPTTIPGGTIVSTTNVIYAGCINNPEGYDLSGGDQQGGGTSMKQLAHDISVAATITGASGVSIGQQRIVNGVGTARPGCPE